MTTQFPEPAEPGVWRMLIGRGLVADGPYLNMGFLPAWRYSEVTNSPSTTVG